MGRCLAVALQDPGRIVRAAGHTVHERFEARAPRSPLDGPVKDSNGERLIARASYHFL